MFLDPDLGWHLRVGKDFITNHIFPSYDKYTFSHPGFAWVDHEWLADVLSYLVHHSWGFGVLAGIFALLILLVLLIQIYLAKKLFQTNGLVILLVVIFSLMVILEFAAVRMQVFSWLGLTILIALLFSYHYQQNKKILFLIPLLFIFWANLHGGFPIGICLLGLATVYYRKKIWFLVLILSLLATLVNPYGLGLWAEIFRTITDSYGKSHIIEWLPLFAYPISFFTMLYLAVFLIYFVLFLARRDKKLPLYYQLFLVITFTGAILNKRNAQIFVFSSLVPLAYFVDSYLSCKLNLRFLAKITTSTMTVITLFWLVTATALMKEWPYFTIDPFDNPANEPYKAVGFLLDNSRYDKVFSELSWGGYLLWKMPESYQVFYDGRMAHWHTKDNRFLAEYFTLYNTEGNWQELLDEYQIKTILLPNEPVFLSWIKQDWFNQLFFKRYAHNLKLKQIPLREKVAQSTEWIKIYDDDQTSIFVKKN